jgi:peroxiredoxin
VDSPYANGAWAKANNFKNITLLSDFWPHGQVASQYGAFMDNLGFTQRAVVVIDENQNIIFHKIYPIEQEPDMSEVYKLL